MVIKIERRGVFPSTLKHEFAVLRQLATVKGIPRALWLGEEGGRNLLVLNRLGPSLEEVFIAQKRTFTLYTIADIATQLV